MSQPSRPTPPPPDPIAQLAAELGHVWPTIEHARRDAEYQRQALASRLEKELPLDTSLVVSGSLGRGELTTGSDIDWMLLADGQAAAGHLDAV